VALAEAEAQAAEIPSLEAGAAPKVVHIPVEGPPLPRTQPAPAPKSPDVAPVTLSPEPPAAVDPPPAKYRVFYGTLDALLSALNRPFLWLSPRARQFVGLVALATLVTSLLALLLLPGSR